MKTIRQIIKLKYEHDLIEEDSTREKQVEWYKWALENSHCVVVKTFFGRVKGFLDWVRLNEFPKSVRDYKLDHSVIDTAPIAFVGNVYAESGRVLRKLKNMAMKFQSDAKYLAWHNKRKGKIRIYKLRRSYAV